MEYVKELQSAFKPKQTYSIADLVDMEAMPWARDHRTIRKLIEQDRTSEDILQARIQGEGKRKRYLIQGKNISNYIKKYGPALLGLQTKTYVKQAKANDDRE